MCYSVPVLTSLCEHVSMSACQHVGKCTCFWFSTELIEAGAKETSKLSWVRSTHVHSWKSQQIRLVGKHTDLTGCQFVFLSKEVKLRGQLYSYCEMQMLKKKKAPLVPRVHVYKEVSGSCSEEMNIPLKHKPRWCVDVHPINRPSYSLSRVRQVLPRAVQWDWVAF